MNYIKNFNDLQLGDIDRVGNKNAFLGHMIRNLASFGIRVADGFAITADVYWYFLEYNNLIDEIQHLLDCITNIYDTANLKKIGAAIRVKIVQARMPPDVSKEIIDAYHALSLQYAREVCDVAVRSSVICEDLSAAAFSGHFETFLNVRGATQLLQKCKESMASLFTERAIVYRHEKGVNHFRVAVSVGIQKMVRADRGSSGLIFSADTETGFQDVILITASYGLGEMIVKGEVLPDEYTVYKPTLKASFDAIIRKRLGAKNEQLVYAQAGDSQRTVVQDVPESMCHQWCLNDAEIVELARCAMAIEESYTNLQGSWSPIDIEWAKDGNDGLLYCMQVRSDTIYVKKSQQSSELFCLEGLHNGKEARIVTGQSIGTGAAVGTVHIVQDIHDVNNLGDDAIIVTHALDSAWMSIIKGVAGIITDKGGRTCHTARTARELGIPAIVGTHNGTAVLKQGQRITLDCSQGSTGSVYNGTFTIKQYHLNRVHTKQLGANILINCDKPDAAFTLAPLPVDGVALIPLECIISCMIGIHPMACVYPEKVAEEGIKAAIKKRIILYVCAQDFFVDTLASGIAMIAAAFYPKRVSVQFSDVKSHNYCELLGEIFFEERELNPILGLRGASRYYHPFYKKGFALECAAIHKVRSTFGLTNIDLVIPFLRTVQEAVRVQEELQKNGLDRGSKDLAFMMMIKVPSTIFLMERFAPLFDAFCIDLNDLTELLVGIDRDSSVLTSIVDEGNPAVVQALEMVITIARKLKKNISVCGQLPSDSPKLGNKPMALGTDSIFLNPDSFCCLE